MKGRPVEGAGVAAATVVAAAAAASVAASSARAGRAVNSQKAAWVGLKSGWG